MTTHHKFNNPAPKPRVLIAPLEWGLGHATRCIPIIHKLLELHCEVLLAAEGATSSLLRSEFPSLTFLPLTGYRVRYSRNKRSLPFTLFIQLPRIILTIYREHQWLKKVVKTNKIDAVISDNRFGLYHPGITSIYITHQLLIKTSNGFTEKVAQHIHYLFINKYSECWVPDALKNGIAGELSHPKKLPEHLQYIGPLSRFEILPGLEIIYDLLITISGPEPQRTFLEEQLLKDLSSHHGKVLFVRGLPGEATTPDLFNANITIVNHLKSEELNVAIQQSAMIISRAGYTTIMDLIKLGKKAILVPTPGQTEQEYLADHLMKIKMFYTVSQDNFSLQKVLKKVNSFPYTIPSYNMEEYKYVVEQFVKRLTRPAIL